LTTQAVAAWLPLAGGEGVGGLVGVGGFLVGVGLGFGDGLGAGALGAAFQ
jgi:hypothetical protein